MLQSATSSEFTPFPSTSEDPYRSLQSNISTDIEEVGTGRFLTVDADIRLADGQAIAGFYLSASGFMLDPHLLSEIESAMTDLQTFKLAIDEWYDDTHTSLIEAQRTVLQAKAEATVSA